jgi:hypothetical protein
MLSSQCTMFHSPKHLLWLKMLVSRFAIEIVSLVYSFNRKSNVFFLHSHAQCLGFLQ